MDGSVAGQALENRAAARYTWWGKRLTPRGRQLGRTKWTLMIAAGLALLWVPAVGQTNFDASLKKALAYSNVHYEAESYTEDVAALIEGLYGTGSEGRKKDLYDRIMGSFDGDYVFACIKEAVLASSSPDFVDAYNRYHETEEYKAINALEERELRPEEKAQYTYARESAYRQGLMRTTATTFDVRRHSIVYYTALYRLILGSDPGLEPGSRSAILARLVLGLERYFGGPETLADQLDYLAVRYHGLDDGRLAAYLGYFLDPDLVEFYFALYEGLGRGILGRDLGRLDEGI